MKLHEEVRYDKTSTTNFAIGRKLSSYKKLNKRIQDVHSDTYNYDKFVFVDMKTKSTITCSIHGDFEQSMGKHLNNKQGCPKCAIDSSRYTTKEFIEKSKTRHEINRYLYDRTIYLGNDKEVEIYCNICKKYFWQNSHNHLLGKGCSICGLKSRAKSLTFTTKEYVTKAQNIHKNNRYLYDKTIYLGRDKEVEVYCTVCKKYFMQFAHSHLKGRGCRSCSITGFNPSKKAILYYICIDEKYYKIGITNNTVKKRFSANFSRIRVVKEWNYEIGQDAYDREQLIIKEFKDSLVDFNPLVLNRGNIEIFNYDILLLDI